MHEAILEDYRLVVEDSGDPFEDWSAGKKFDKSWYDRQLPRDDYDDLCGVKKWSESKIYEAFTGTSFELSFLKIKLEHDNKLLLLVDIDPMTMNSYQKEDPESFDRDNCPLYTLCIRHFFKRLSPYYNFVLATSQEERFGREFLAVLDPNKRLFKNALLLHKDNMTAGLKLSFFKSLRPIDESQICILDEPAAWHHNSNVFATHLFNSSLVEGRINIRGYTHAIPYLQVVYSNLRELHSRFFQEDATYPRDVSFILSRLRRNVLKGLHIFYLGGFDSYFTLIAQLGATRQSEPDINTTHLVMDMTDTSSAMKGEKIKSNGEKQYLVTTEWLVACLLTLSRREESEFDLSKNEVVHLSVK